MIGAQFGQLRLQGGALLRALFACLAGGVHGLLACGIRTRQLLARLGELRRRGRPGRSNVSQTMGAANNECFEQCMNFLHSRNIANRMSPNCVYLFEVEANEITLIILHIDRCILLTLISYHQ